MKTRTLFLLSTLIMTTHISMPAYAWQPTDEQIIAHLQRQTPQSKTAVPEWIKDKYYSGTNPQSLVIKSIIIDGFYDRYVDIYYTNGQLVSHTPLVDGVPHGWSEEYRASGTKMRRILYEHGKIIKVEHYDDKGDLNQVLYAE